MTEMIALVGIATWLITFAYASIHGREAVSEREMFVRRYGKEIGR